MPWSHATQHARRVPLVTRRTTLGGALPTALAFSAITREHTGALIVLHNTMFLTHRSRIADLAAKP